MGKIRRIIITGLVIFVLLYISFLFANQLTNYLESKLYEDMIVLLNHNIVTLVIVYFALFFSAVFSEVRFPYNIPSPIFDSTAVVLLVVLGIQIIDILRFYLEIPAFNFDLRILYGLSFFATLFMGYISMFINYRKDKQETEINVHVVKMKEKTMTWGKIKEEFKEVIYRILEKIQTILGIKKK